MRPEVLNHFRGRAYTARDVFGHIHKSEITMKTYSTLGITAFSTQNDDIEDQEVNEEAEADDSSDRKKFVGERQKVWSNLFNAMEPDDRERLVTIAKEWNDEQPPIEVQQQYVPYSSQNLCPNIIIQASIEVYQHLYPGIRSTDV